MSEMSSLDETVIVDDGTTQDSVTMVDVLRSQQELEDNANAVLGASDPANCTYFMGYLGRQALYSCRTCLTSSNERAGICLACSLSCHDGHELVELYTKRNFRCDCGNSKFPNFTCQLSPEKRSINEDNKYNHNFDGKYCKCERPYPDPDGENDEMIQCVVCEDWYHGKHTGSIIPDEDDYEEMICHSCFEKTDVLQHYYAHRVGGPQDVEISSGCTKPSISATEPWKTGAVFFPSAWREKLCRCTNCLVLYKDIEFLLDSEDEVNSYENKGRQSRLSQYEEGMQALSSMDRGQQIEVLYEFNALKSGLLDYLKKFAEENRVVSEQDIHQFFQELRERKRRRLDSEVNIPSFCR